LLDVTVGNRSLTINVNETALKGKHFVTTAMCGTRRFVWDDPGPGWGDNGFNAPCKT
jgi:hypothetical protein